MVQTAFELGYARAQLVALGDHAAVSLSAVDDHRKVPFGVGISTYAATGCASSSAKRRRTAGPSGNWFASPCRARITARHAAIL